MDDMTREVVKDALETAVETFEDILTPFIPVPEEQTVMALNKLKAALRLLEEK
jgi:hypothetical protein